MKTSRKMIDLMEASSVRPSVVVVVVVEVGGGGGRAALQVNAF